MAARRYTETEVEFITSFAYGHGYKEIAEAFNERFNPPVDSEQIHYFLVRRKIQTGRKESYLKRIICRPHVSKPLGSEQIRRSSSNGNKYAYVKVAEPNKWRPKHIVEWEKNYGEMPRGKVVIFLDGNTLNSDMENLMLVDRKVNLIMNRKGLRYQDADCTRAGACIAELISAIAEAKRR
ncbi:HNH endonuclease signature motif containing protein [Lacrimispora indolis]|uniref:HNH endonuclease signature motif containing protein n=1 Tax=Lacrimispora indolis TaxID=69825 RepID=UPI00045EB279|nr:HNH endonuclease signature motif containing protein [Lacrimispora indolis]